MNAPLYAEFVAIAFALFITELTDKDAILLLTLATRRRATLVFAAGATAFLFTTFLFVSVGTLLVRVIPITWVKVVGGAIMIGYGLWEARLSRRLGEFEKEEAAVKPFATGVKAFLGLVVALALLDIAGDATEILTFVLVAQYSNPLLVFFGASTGLIVATGLETALGNRLGGLLTLERLRHLSVAVFVILGALILGSTFLV